MSALYSHDMCKRLQLILDEDELRAIQEIAKQHRTTVAEGVRQALRAARLQKPRLDAERKLKAIWEIVDEVFAVELRDVERAKDILLGTQQLSSRDALHLAIMERHQMVKNRLLSTPPSEMGLPAIVLFEMELGIAKSSSPRKRIGQLKDFTSLVNVIPFGASEAKTAAQIRAKLEKIGIPIVPYDVLIAACAKVSELILVTHNLKEFKRIEGLRLEDWY